VEIHRCDSRPPPVTTELALGDSSWRGTPGTLPEILAESSGSGAVGITPPLIISVRGKEVYSWPAKGSWKSPLCGPVLEVKTTDKLTIKSDGRIWPPGSQYPDTPLHIEEVPVLYKRSDIEAERMRVKEEAAISNAMLVDATAAIARRDEIIRVLQTENRRLGALNNDDVLRLAVNGYDDAVDAENKRIPDSDCHHNYCNERFMRAALVAINKESDIMNIKIANPGEFTVSAPNNLLYTPEVGTCAKHGVQTTQLQIRFNPPIPENGDYCLQCWAEWAVKMFQDLHLL